MSYITERREDEKERRRIEIIEAAEALYAERGWDAVTMDAVARGARLSRALIYVYFRDKEDLLLAIAQRALDELKRRFTEAAARHPLAIDQIEAMGRAYVLFQQHNPFQFDACTRYHSHQAKAGEPCEQACTAAGDALMAVMVATLELGLKDGSIRQDLADPLQVCVMLWAFTHGLIQIATTKSQEIARHGVEVPKLMEDAYAMLRRMLVPAASI